MYIYIHDVGTPAMFFNLVDVVIRWPTKAPAYAVDVAGGGGATAKRLNKRLNK